MTLSSSPSDANSSWISARMASVGDTRAATGVGLLRELSALRGNLRPLHVYTGVLTPPCEEPYALCGWRIPAGTSGWPLLCDLLLPRPGWPGRARCSGDRRPRPPHRASPVL